VIASLANILAYQASIGGRAVNGPPSTGASIITATAIPRPAHAREYNFLDFEIKYGIRQVSRFPRAGRLRLKHNQYLRVHDETPS